jgi:hypothetical protein
MPHTHLTASTSETNIGAVGWGAIGVFALAWDMYAEQTLSNFAHERISDPRTRLLALGAVAVTAAHLTRPESLRSYDPITRLGTALREFTRP